MIASVNIISPILYNGEWKMIGEVANIDADVATDLEKSGMVEIVSINGVIATWGSCCSNHSS